MISLKQLNYSWACLGQDGGPPGCRSPVQKAVSALSCWGFKSSAHDWTLFMRTVSVERVCGWVCARTQQGLLLTFRSFTSSPTASMTPEPSIPITTGGAGSSSYSPCLPSSSAKFSPHALTRTRTSPAFSCGSGCVFTCSFTLSYPPCPVRTRALKERRFSSAAGMLPADSCGAAASGAAAGAAAAAAGGGSSGCFSCSGCCCWVGASSPDMVTTCDVRLFWVFQSGWVVLPVRMSLLLKKQTNISDENWCKYPPLSTALSSEENEISFFFFFLQGGFLCVRSAQQVTRVNTHTVHSPLPLWIFTIKHVGYGCCHPLCPIKQWHLTTIVLKRCNMLKIQWKTFFNG